MSYRSARSAVLAAAVVVGVAASGILSYLSLVGSSSAASPMHLFRSDHHGVLGEADGVVPDGVTVFDDDYPAVAKLDPDLLGALRRAATNAAGDGVEFYVSSGWRSPAYQEQLLQEAVSKYGTEAEAARWVATPTTSLHVSGDAVDIGSSEATEWLSELGAEYGLWPNCANVTWSVDMRTS